MKRIIVLGACALALPAFTFPITAAAQVETYNIDQYHTVPYWETDHLGFATLRGRFDRATGSFTIDRGAKAGTFDIVIQTASLNTGDTDRGTRPRTRDEHLRTSDFFNVAEFPTMTFKGNKVVFNGDDVASVEGNLTLLGVTRPVTLKMTRWKCGPDMRARATSAAATPSARSSARISA